MDFGLLMTRPLSLPRFHAILTDANLDARMGMIGDGITPSFLGAGRFPVEPLGKGGRFL